MRFRVKNLRRTAALASCSVAVVLILSKLLAFALTDSVALLSSLLDSGVDLIASLFTLFGVATALNPPDREHRFGHGKAEPLAALAQAAFVCGSALLLCNEAIGRFFHPMPLQNPTVGYAVMALAIFLTFFLVLFQKNVVKRTGSLAISADRLHYAGDLFVNLAVILAFVIQQATGLAWVDPLFGLAIAAFLLSSAYKIGIEALHILMDREVPNEVRERIKNAIRSISEVEGFHDLRTRSDSEKIFIEIHLELDPKLTLAAAHGISDKVSQAISLALPTAETIVHMDPAGLVEKRRDATIGEYHV